MSRHRETRPDPGQERASAAHATRARLRQAARRVVCEAGLAGASARTIAARAQVNQALIFYHFHTVSELLEAASNEAVDESVARYRATFARVRSLDDLVAVARQLHDQERAVGNVAFMAQMLSGAQHDPVLARASRYAMTSWTREVHLVLARVVQGGPLAGLVDLEGLAHLVSAGFVGIELYGAVDGAGADRALDTLHTLGGLVTIVEDLGPVTRRAVTAKMNRHR